jgi:hypothetical protein
VVRPVAAALKDDRRRSDAPGFAGRSMDAEDLSSGMQAWCSGEGARSAAGLLVGPAPAAAGLASLLTRGADVALRVDGSLWLEESERLTMLLLGLLYQ